PSRATLVPYTTLFRSYTDEQNLPEIGALATIVKVQGMHRVADAYGPIPYVNYGSGTLQNNYNSLEEIYNKFFEELDEAIEVLTLDRKSTRLNSSHVKI